MLSNTAEINPRPSAVGHDGAGNSSTGIIEAQTTKAKRKIVPLAVSGRTAQSGRRSGAVARMTVHTAMPINGNASSTAGNVMFAITLTATAQIRMAATMKKRVHSI